MPLLVAAVLFVLVLLAAIALMPLSLVLRYRRGTSRRRAIGWVAAVNLAGLMISSLLFLTVAAVTSIWVRDAFWYTLAGFVAGCALGALGLGLTRWESAQGFIYYTPNRWLVLAITVLVAARIVYGFWRGWHSWRAGMDDWAAATGAAGAMAAGAVVLGYYFFYWRGVRRRLMSGR